MISLDIIYFITNPELLACVAAIESIRSLFAISLSFCILEESISILVGMIITRQCKLQE